MSLTAAEARKLAGPSDEEELADALDEAYKTIKIAAENKKRFVALHGAFWVGGGYSTTPLWRKEGLFFMMRVHQKLFI